MHQRVLIIALPESDKKQLHIDAKRLFYDSKNERHKEWEARYDVKYRSRGQAERHKISDATAFVSVVLPAHYSAIVSVLDHVKQRLEPGWTIKSVIDWGAGTGTALW